MSRHSGSMITRVRLRVVRGIRWMSAIGTSLANSCCPIRSGFVGTAATPRASRASYLGNIREGWHFGLRSREFAAGDDLQRRRPRTIVLDLASNESLTYGEHEGSAYHGQFGSTCHHPLVCSASSVMSSGAPAMMRQRRIAGVGASARCSTRSPRDPGNRTDLRAPDRARRRKGSLAPSVCGHCQLGSIVGYSLPPLQAATPRWTRCGSSSNLIM